MQIFCKKGFKSETKLSCVWHKQEITHRFFVSFSDAKQCKVSKISGAGWVRYETIIARNRSLITLELSCFLWQCFALSWNLWDAEIWKRRFTWLYYLLICLYWHRISWYSSSSLKCVNFCPWRHSSCRNFIRFVGNL